METLDRLRSRLGEIPGDALEVRIRAGRPAQYRCPSGDAFGPKVSPEALRELLSYLTDHSLYSREAELREGYFTMNDGCRVGVCGRMSHSNERGEVMTAVGSLCVRVCREHPGAADGFYHALFAGEARELRSALIVSPPGMGKTTALRDAARRLSEAGYNVCVADERHELAACVDGVPTLDVGPRTDVMDGCAKHVAVTRLLRACAPDVIVTDEIGDRRDAEALTDAARCGVRLLASAHAESIDRLMARRSVDITVFDIVVLLGEVPGRVLEIRRL